MVFWPYFSTQILFREFICSTYIMYDWFNSKNCLSEGQTNMHTYDVCFINEEKLSIKCMFDTGHKISSKQLIFIRTTFAIEFHIRRLLYLVISLTCLASDRFKMNIGKFSQWLIEKWNNVFLVEWKNSI